jgi:hypothetical protein
LNNVGYVFVRHSDLAGSSLLRRSQNGRVEGQDVEDQTGIDGIRQSRSKDFELATEKVVKQNSTLL